MLNEQPSAVSASWHEYGTIDCQPVTFLCRGPVPPDTLTQTGLPRWMREVRLRDARVELGMQPERLR